MIMSGRPSIYICLLCGWQGEPRELKRDQEGTRLFCPCCGQPASFLMDMSESPYEFLSMRRGAYLASLEAKRDELHLKPTPELRSIIRQFKRILGEEAEA